MNSLFAPIMINGKAIKNRVVFPPVVCFHYAGDDGMVTERNYKHYKNLAEGGAGVIVVEATAVWRDGRLAPFQLGLWSDEQIPGMSKLAEIIKNNHALALVQLHHAGLVTPETVHPWAQGPSVSEQNVRSQTLQLHEIETLRNAFIEAALRAKKAGFDGVELHGAHGYLLNQFASSFFNKREDNYGGTKAGRLKFAQEIIQGIRNRCGDQFIIDYRMGANCPTLEDGMGVAKALEQYGIDLLHVSHGGSLQNLPRPPKDFDYNWIVYSGCEIKKTIQIPVIGVNEIKTAERAHYLLTNNYLDFVALGRPLLADPHWVNHVQRNEPVNVCSSCKPKCKWCESSTLCPAVQRLLTA